MSRALNYHLRAEAYQLVGIARKEDRLSRPSRCESCAATKGYMAHHHHDYARPLDVIPLCGSCHQRVHSGVIPEPRTGRVYKGEAPTVPPSTFGECLKVGRQAIPLRQSALAATITAIGAPAHQSTVSEWERGERRPTLPQWKALVQVMEWTPGEIDRARALIPYEMGT